MEAGLFLAAGLVALIIGAELVVSGASRLAYSLGVSPLVIGLTIVSIGTSAPELAVGITASLAGSGDLAVGNIAGTNTLNILFILGLSALLKPLPLHLRILKLELPVMIFAAGLMTVMTWDGVITRLDGGVLVSIAIVYTIVLVRMSRAEPAAVREEFREAYEPESASARRPGLKMAVWNATLLTGGLVLSVLGADWLVDGSVSIARLLGISESVIGLTIVAVGTSAPELVTTIVATLKDDRDVAVGNLIGSSIYNIVVILGVSCLVTPGGIVVASELLIIDIVLMVGVVLLCIPVFVSGTRVSRAEGGLFVLLYLGYMLSLLLFRL